ncbi:MAG: hypothetical protein IKR18_11515 [Bacteroidaceae bacterium]|nr:hypothetical protein [Bacteroidaceae bacterium]
MKFSPKVLEGFVRRIYGRKFDVEHDIDAQAWREVLRIMNEATVEGIMQSKEPPTKDMDFYKALRHSNEVFSAFKVHTMGKEMAAKLTDADGRLKSFSDWRRDIESIASHQVGAWLHTEYNTAVVRAHAAADWQQYLRDKDVMPNLRWMPTTSSIPELTHRKFWNARVNLPVDHPFWTKHYPGDHWNCKCTLEQNDEPIVTTNTDTDDLPQRGLEGNPGKTMQTFSDKHPYFPKSCKECGFYKSGVKNRLKVLFRNQDKDCNNCLYIDKEINPLLDLQQKAANKIREIKESIDKFMGIQIKDESFDSGTLRILRRSFTDVYEHNKEDENLMKWLSDFSLTMLHGWKHEGWAENRTYKSTDVKYDPKNPNKKKHPETLYFNYYSLKINRKTYWANVKVHKGYNGDEVLYTIESKKPKDLIPGKYSQKKR